MIVLPVTPEMTVVVSKIAPNTTIAPEKEPATVTEPVPVMLDGQGMLIAVALHQREFVSEVP